MKTLFRNFLFVILFLFCYNISSNAYYSGYDEIMPISASESNALIMEYGYPVNINYSCIRYGGCYTTEGAPLPWGEFNGYIDKTYFIGGDCVNFRLDIDVNMVEGADKVLIYELDYNYNLVVSAVIHGHSQFRNVYYDYQHILPNREAFIYLRVIKNSDDDPSFYDDSYYNFRGIYWWVNNVN